MLPKMLALTLAMVAGAVADVVVVLDGDDLVALRRAGPRPYCAPPANLGSSPIADVRLDDAWTERVRLAEGARARSLHRRALTESRLVMAFVKPKRNSFSSLGVTA